MKRYAILRDIGLGGRVPEIRPAGTTRNSLTADLEIDELSPEQAAKVRAKKDVRFVAPTMPIALIKPLDAAISASSTSS